jgi:hypothetical protein
MNGTQMERRPRSDWEDGVRVGHVVTFTATHLAGTDYGQQLVREASACRKPPVFVLDFSGVQDFDAEFIQGIGFFQQVMEAFAVLGAKWAIACLADDESDDGMAARLKDQGAIGMFDSVAEALDALNE